MSSLAQKCVASPSATFDSFTAQPSECRKPRSVARQFACKGSIFRGRCTKLSAAKQNGKTQVRIGAVRTEAAAEFDRPNWLPGSTAPAYLDGSLPGDFGFDPLALGQQPEDLRWYVQAELVHARFAMAGVAGILVTDIMRVSGIKDLPVWYEAGAQEFEIADTRTLFAIQLLLFGFVEAKRYMDYKSPGSQGSEDSWFFGWEEAFSGVAAGYPGGPLFNPLGLASSTDPAEVQPMRIKEIKNGRLAMVAMVGFAVQAYVTHQGPVDNLLTHLSDPWHKTIFQTLAATS